MYPPEKRRWIRNYMQAQCRLGVFREIICGMEPNPDFVSAVVLVANGQSQQDYRLCVNLAQVNTRIELPAHPMPDCASVIDLVGGSEYGVYSGLDVKSGFHNVYIPKRL